MTEKSLTEEIRDIRHEAEQIEQQNGSRREPAKDDQANSTDASSAFLDELRRENEQLKARLSDAGRDVTHTLIRDQAKLEHEIRANPLQSILIAGLAGFVAASLFSRPGRF